MRRKIGALKITICAAFLLALGATFLLAPNAKIAAVQTSADTVNTQNCAACHQSNGNSQHQTIHQKTVREATRENVQGDFYSNNYFEYEGAKIEMSSDGINFFVKIGDESYKVEAVVGAKYIEQYIAEKNGEFYSLPIGYNLSEKRWLHLNDADFGKKTADFSRHLQKWQIDCAACHRSGADDFSSDFGDFGISCGACHTNAAEHLAAKTSFWAKLGFSIENKVGNPNDLSSDAAMAICASCHSRDVGEPPPFAEIVGDKNLISAHQTAAFDAEKYWFDGANKFSGSEYRAIVRSVCYVQSKSGGHGIAGEKINCASCHSLHEASGETLKTGKSYNQNCVNCHSQFADDAAIAEHTKHQINSEASNCASCHQPETVYGRMRFTRTHEISVPNPVLTIEKQIPNACNLCHTDKSANWAVLSSRKFWAERFLDSKISADKQFDRPEALRNLSSDDDFLRALAADSLRKHSDFKWSAPFLSEAFQIETASPVRNFLAAALKSKAAELPSIP